MSKRTKLNPAARPSPDDENLIGKVASYRVKIRGVKPQSLVVEVTVRGLRRNYGRVDFLVTPYAGSGEAWVSKADIIV